MIQECTAQKFLHLQSHHIERLRVDRIGLGQHRDSALHAEKLQDIEVLPRLGLNGLVRCNYQQHQVNAAHPSQHVAHKSLVPGYVHKTQPQLLAIRARQVHVRKSEVNGDASPFLFLQSIRVDPGQRLHQRCLPVVDMPGRSHDDGFHSVEIILGPGLQPTNPGRGFCPESLQQIQQPFDSSKEISATLGFPSASSFGLAAFPGHQSRLGTIST